MNQNSLAYLKLSLCALLLALVAPLAIDAQTTLPPTPGFEERARKKTSLDRESKEVADEYADVLYELQSLVRDYREYLSESDSRTITKYLVKLELFSNNLDRRLYVADRKRLSEDLTAHIDELRVIQKYIEESEEIFPMRVLKLVASFRRDLSNIDELLESDVLERLSKARAREDAIEAYVDALLADMQVEQRDGHTIITIPQFDEKKLKEMELQAEKMARDAEKMAEQSARIRTKVVAPKAPRPSDPPIVIDLDRDGDISLLSMSGTSKVLEDTLTVTNPKRPIEISNSLGAVHVGGTQSKQIVARLRVEISADTRSREKQLLSDIKLELKATPTGYTVESATPMNNNPGTDSRVVSAELEVLVPASNPITLNSSFGDITVSELNAGIQIVSTYAQVEVEKVRGGVDICNTMGQVEVDWCSGPIKIKNAYSDITLNECNGNYDVENAYSQVILEGCEGSGEIRNSGVVLVTNHSGNLNINNSFGPITVEGMSGDLTANNQFSPLSIRDIKGKVTVENANSNIDIANINGLLVATNRFGLIQAEDLAGPVRLDNQNGNIYLVLNEAYKGNSWVSTTFGNVDITIPETANLWVKAKTTFGEIKSDFPFKFNDLGTSKSGALKLGRGADSLSISAENSTIKISEK